MFKYPKIESVLTRNENTGKLNLIDRRTAEFDYLKHSKRISDHFFLFTFFGRFFTFTPLVHSSRVFFVISPLSYIAPNFLA